MERLSVMNPQFVKYVSSPAISVGIEELKAMVDHMKKSAELAPFSNCPARYDGTREVGVLDRFIATVTLYKSCNKISDESAVEGFSRLLVGPVKNCWESEKLKKPTWLNALNWLKLTYDTKEPAYVIYQDIVNLKQTENMSLEKFIGAKLKLFSQLSFDNIEEMKLDMVYGQMLEKFKYSIPRETVSNLKELLEKGNRVERQWKEKSGGNGNPPTIAKRKKGPRCMFCRYRGHTFQDCRKKFAADAPKCSCNGSETSGTVKTKCLKCVPKILSANRFELGFCD